MAQTCKQTIAVRAVLKNILCTDRRILQAAFASGVSRSELPARHGGIGTGKRNNPEHLQHYTPPAVMLVYGCLDVRVNFTEIQTLTRADESLFRLSPSISEIMRCRGQRLHQCKCRITRGRAEPKPLSQAGDTGCAF